MVWVTSSLLMSRLGTWLSHQWWNLGSDISWFSASSNYKCNLSTSLLALEKRSRQASKSCRLNDYAVQRSLILPAIGKGCSILPEVASIYIDRINGVCSRSSSHCCSWTQWVWEQLKDQEEQQQSVIISCIVLLERLLFVLFYWAMVSLPRKLSYWQWK